MIKELLEKIKVGVENNEEVKFFESIYQQLFQLFTFQACTIIAEQDFFRGRWATENLFSRIDELKYPPVALIKEKGRLNDIREQIAYMSDSPITVIAELDFDYYDIFCLATIELTNKNLLFCDAGWKRDKTIIVLNNERIEDAEEAVRYLNMILTSPEKNYYNATIAFAHFTLNTDVKVKGLDIPLEIGLVYSSAQEHKSNNLLGNIAVPPKIFDKYFVIKQAEYCILHKFNDGIKMSVINNGIINKDGAIVWERTFTEMKDYCNAKFGNDLFGWINQDEKIVCSFNHGSGKVIAEDEKTVAVKFRKQNVVISKNDIIWQ